MAILSLKRIAIAFILGGVVLYAGSQYWLATRKLVPLDIPISLSRGHIRTPEFSINMDSGYNIAIEVDRIPPAPAVLRAQWALSSSGQLELTGSSDDQHESWGWGDSGTRDLGGFWALGGWHRLDIDVLTDASILNRGNPRLRVLADGEAYRRLGDIYDELPIVSGMLISIGVVLLWLASRERKVEHAPDLSIFKAPGAGQRRAGYLRKLPRSALFSGLPPSFALLAVSLLLLVSVPVWNAEFWRIPARGILVLTSAQGRLTPRYGQGANPLTLRIDKQRRWFFEGEEVSPEEFPVALRQALNRRPDPFVCLDADPGLDLAVPGQAMDMLQGLFVKIIIATPNAKADGCTATIGR